MRQAGALRWIGARNRRGPTCAVVALQLVWTAVVVTGFHYRAVAPELRHARVAEGNISHVVGSIWREGVGAWWGCLRQDAREWGRVRPMHNIFHQVPFFATLVRNGDLCHVDPDVPIHARINGDLQTHVACLLGFVAAATAFMAVSIGKFCTLRWLPFLMAPVFAAGNLALAENLLVNYADSGEVAQITFLSGYWVCTRALFAGAVPRRSAYSIGLCCLVMAYAMKETTLAIAPPVCCGLVALAVIHRNAGIKYRMVIAATLVCHIVLALALVGGVHAARVGAYVAQNYEVQREVVWARAVTWWGLLATNRDDVVFVLLVVLLVPWVVILGRRGAVGVGAPIRAHGDRASVPTSGVSAAGPLWLAIAVLCASAAAFFAVNIPWGQPLRKYTLPALFLTSAAAILIVEAGYRVLRARDLRYARYLWVLGAMFSLLRALPAYAKDVEQFYASEYAHRTAVPLVCKDVADAIQPNDSVRACHLVLNPRFQEGDLQFARWLNRFYRLNIGERGRIVSEHGTVERNYMRRYADRPTIELTASFEIPESVHASTLYLVGLPRPAEDAQLRTEPFALMQTWELPDGTSVCKYQRK